MQSVINVSSSLTTISYITKQKSPETIRPREREKKPNKQTELNRRLTQALGVWISREPWGALAGEGAQGVGADGVVSALP